jgi:hypothetical protein
MSPLFKSWFSVYVYKPLQWLHFFIPDVTGNISLSVTGVFSKSCNFCRSYPKRFPYIKLTEHSDSNNTIQIQKIKSEHTWSFSLFIGGLSITTVSTLDDAVNSTALGLTITIALRTTAFLQPQRRILCCCCKQLNLVRQLTSSTLCNDDIPATNSIKLVIMPTSKIWEERT